MESTPTTAPASSPPSEASTKNRLSRMELSWLSSRSLALLNGLPWEQIQLRLAAREALTPGPASRASEARGIASAWREWLLHPVPRKTRAKLVPRLNPSRRRADLSRAAANAARPCDFSVAPTEHSPQFYAHPQTPCRRGHRLGYRACRPRRRAGLTLIERYRAWEHHSREFR